MDIVIKSFNRAYYLERCIRSIYKHVEGTFRIQVLDDGTPPEYLEKIVALFPDIKIFHSSFYDRKVNAIKDHLTDKKKFDLFFIPTELWFRQIALCSDFFLLLEDDIWLTQPLSLGVVEEEMRKNNLVLTKLYWGGNWQGKFVGLNDALEEVIPQIPSYPVPLLRLIFLNKFKLGSILHRLGIIKEGVYFQLPFYTLYSVASAFFNKEYWLYLWDDKQLKADESFQLLKAVEWFRRKRTRYAKMTEEKTATSFITSATNIYSDIALDVFRFNHHLNEAWLVGKFDSMENFPKDFSISYIKQFLEQAGDRKSTYKEWLKWIKRFKGIYRSMGVHVDT